MPSGWIFFVLSSSWKISLREELEADIFQLARCWPTGTHKEPGQVKSLSVPIKPETLKFIWFWVVAFEVEFHFILTSFATTRCLSWSMSNRQSWLDCSEKDPNRRTSLFQKHLRLLYAIWRQTVQREPAGPGSGLLQTTPRSAHLRRQSVEELARSFCISREAKHNHWWLFLGEDKDFMQPCPKLPSYC